MTAATIDNLAAALYPIAGAPDIRIRDMALYGYDPLIPLVDHPHERSHQHQTFWNSLLRKQPDANLYPNYPDVDVREASTKYLVEVEVPGIKDASEITCEWTQMKSLVVTGCINRPPSESQSPSPEAASRTEAEGDRNELGTRESKGEDKPSKHDEPFLLVGERKIGPFRRHFYFPVDVERENLTAKLEAGLLKIRVPKKKHAAPKGDGKISVQIQG
jgi:HSP20 family molecular chaperone IbpA